MTGSPLATAVISDDGATGAVSSWSGFDAIRARAEASVEVEPSSWEATVSPSAFQYPSANGIEVCGAVDRNGAPPRVASAVALRSDLLAALLPLAEGDELAEVDELLLQAASAAPSAGSASSPSASRRANLGPPGRRAGLSGVRD